MAQYNLIFQGKIIDGASLDEVKRNVAQLFKTDAVKTEALFSGKSIVIKKNLDTETTKKYLAVLKKAGAVVNPVKIEARPVSEKNQTENSGTSEKSPEHSSADSTNGLSAGLASLVNYNTHPPAKEETKATDVVATEPVEPAILKPATQTSKLQSDSGLELAPENAGPLNLHPATETIELPDISHLSMSPPQSGSLEEFAQEIEAVELPDIENLTLSEANTGSLEEFAIKTEPVELPDISALDIAEQNDTPLSDASPRPEPADIPDISGLSMSEAQEGTLEGLESKPEPVEIPDTTHLDIEKPEEKPKSQGKATFQIN